MDKFDSENFINPLVDCGPGQCPNCGANLAVVDGEMNYMLLGESGTPVNCENLYVRCEATCLNCGEKFEMRRNGHGMSYDISTRFTRIMEEYEAEHHMESLKYTPAPLIYNPFVKKGETND